MDYEVFDREVRAPMLKDAADAVAGELVRMERLAKEKTGVFEYASKSCTEALQTLKADLPGINMLLRGNFQRFLQELLETDEEIPGLDVLLGSSTENAEDPVQKTSIHIGNAVRRFLYRHFGFGNYVKKIASFMCKYTEYVGKYRILCVRYKKLKEQLFSMNNSSAMQIESFAILMEVRNGALINAANFEDLDRARRSRYPIPEFPDELIDLPEIKPENVSEEALRNVLSPYFVLYNSKAPLSP